MPGVIATIPKFSFSANGVPMVGGTVDTYIAGSTTPTTTWQDSALTIANTNPITLDARGECVLWLDPAVVYKFVLKSSPANGGVVQWTQDNISNPAALANTLRADLSASSGASLVKVIQSGIGAVAITLQDDARTILKSSQFSNIDPTGATDSSVGIATALAALRVMGGGELRLGRGVFLLNGIAGADGILNGILVPYLSSNSFDARVQIVGDGKATILKAGSNTMIIARLSDSHSGIENVTFNGNSKSAVWALGILPESVTQTTLVVNQNYNHCANFYISGCTEGIVMQAGPKAGGTDSGCWYNNISDYQVYATTRAVWLRAPANLASGCNANTFTRGRHGQSPMNTGIQIDSGGGNEFFAVHNEGVAAGVSPNSTPTAVKILSVDAWGTSNDNNIFYGTRNEANTRDFDNGNASTCIFGGEWNAAKFGGAAVKPRYMVGGDPSLMPTITPEFDHGEGVTGYPSGYVGFKKEVADTGFPWVTHSLTTSNVTNTVSVGSVESKFKQLGNIVDWNFTVAFAATVAGTELLITPPIAANVAMYGTTATRNAFYSFFVEDGSGTRKAVEGGWTNAGKFYVKSPGSWAVGSGNVNVLFCIVSYHN